jgi:hypothetical protein
MESKHIQDAAKAFGQMVVERAQRNLGATRIVNGKRRRAVSTGTLKNDLTYKPRHRNNKTTIDFTTKSESTRQYADVVEYGRRKGAKVPKIKPIMDWIKRKPIKLKDKNGKFISMQPYINSRGKTTDPVLGAAIAIAKSISKNGTPAVKYFNEAIQTTLDDDDGKLFLDSMEKEIELRLLLNSRKKQNNL